MTTSDPSGPLYAPRPGSAPSANAELLPRVVVAGNVNLETRVAVGGFPLACEKVRYVPDGVGDRVGGVGWNVAAALARLGYRVTLAGWLGDDPAGAAVRREASARGIDLGGMPAGEGIATPRSVVLEGADGAGAIFTDLKRLEARPYPVGLAATLLTGARHLHATNIRWALDLARAARGRGLSVSTDVQAITGPEDDYARAFVAESGVVLFSSERLARVAGDPSAGARAVVAAWREEFPARWFIAGCGADGALIAAPDGAPPLLLPSAARAVAAGATGAGDTLAAAVVDGFLAGLPPRALLDRAQRFVAAYLAGIAGAARWPDRATLDGGGRAAPG